jgi:hypothetical protein
MTPPTPSRPIARMIQSLGPGCVPRNPTTIRLAIFRRSAASPALDGAPDGAGGGVVGAGVGPADGWGAGDEQPARLAATTPALAPRNSRRST